MARKKDSLFPEATGPDKDAIAARVQAGRQRALELADQPYRGPRACQERRCMNRALPGEDFCASCKAKPPETIRRVGRITFARSVGEIANELTPQEPAKAITSEVPWS